MKNNDDYTQSELREKNHVFAETALFIMIVIFCINPIVRNWGREIVEERRLKSALANTYETLSGPTASVTLANGKSYDDVKVIHTHDWTGTEWEGKRPEEGFWCMEDGRVILVKGACSAVQSLPDK